MNTVKPELAGGFRDYLPEDQIARQKMIDTIKRTFECFGFAPLETPGLERLEVLTGGDPDFDKQIFRASLADGDEKLGLRFDLTVPLARVVAANSDKITFPFKRYQIGKVWRGESPQAGRYREFTQCDVDIVGTPSCMADAEIIALMCNVLDNLGLSDYIVKIGSRKLFEELFSFANLEKEKLPSVLRAIDKLDKLGWNGVMSELKDKVGLDRPQTEKIKKFVEDDSTDMCDELEGVVNCLEKLGIPKEKYKVDKTIVRGLGYYTGTIFEISILGSSVGSIGGGGRYDQLVNRFSPLNIPAVGASIGFDRLFIAMDEKGLIKREEAMAKVLVLNFEGSCQNEVQEIATQLRMAGISTELYVGQEDTLKGQLSCAVKKEYPIVIFVGADEKKRGVIQIKNMNTREQTEVPAAQAVDAIRKLLK
jgi:histidyl-tRNA synthetase